MINWKNTSLQIEIGILPLNAYVPRIKEIFFFYTLLKKNNRDKTAESIK